MAARTPRVNPEATWRVYSALAAAAGVRRPVASTTRASRRALRTGRRRPSPCSSTSRPITVAGDLLVDDGAGPLPAGRHALEPFGATVVRNPAAAAPAAAATEGRDAGR